MQTKMCFMVLEIWQFGCGKDLEKFRNLLKEFVKGSVKGVCKSILVFFLK